MRILTTGLFLLAVIALVGCQAGPEGPTAHVVTSSDGFEFGVEGHVKNPLGGGLSGYYVGVICIDPACYGPFFDKQSKEPSREGDGWWYVEFTEDEADIHNGHKMRAYIVDGTAYADFTYYKPITGPVDIIVY